MSECASCGGTGWWLINKSWFVCDGYKRERCHICYGTGLSNYKDNFEFCAEQKRRRMEATDD